ncbi:type VII secretion protein EccB [Nocardia blacklockiae]|uniref:type VII secretion protein EccB n=1 Tax=Nocardia blacklockiae TaxID=480036 RepID=UPI00189329AE|nr:type VII secretion protein EccB [Nocardia blacklockiae]MBF6171394.1 type VII secretion protein EccB [Nocardia blacklockiae]
MPAQLTTRAQVNGYRFLLRRLDHALIRRDVRMLHDPMRSQLRSLLVGAVLSVLIVAGAAILAFLRPQGAIGDELIVSGKQSGALYVVVHAQDGSTRLHPVLNLASARLITGSNAAPHAVADNKLDEYPRGPLLGIPGAPAALPGSRQGDHSHWALCESMTGGTRSAGGGTTTVVAGPPELSDRTRVAGGDSALLVRHGDKTYLIYDGKRAEVDPANSVMSRSLSLSTARPRPVGTGFLGATGEVPPLTPPQIDRAGQPGPGPLSKVPVGGIISVPSLARGGQPDLYVVLADGVQPVSPFTAQVIRNSNSQGMSDIATVPPDVLDQVPQRHTLRVDQFPAQVPKLLVTDDTPVVCVAWSKSPATAADPGRVEGPGERAVVSILAGTRLPIPNSAKPVELATADGTGDRVDTVYLAPGSGEFVQATGIESGSARRDGLFYIGDNGIRYGVPDTATAGVLGLGDKPRLAPWPIVGQLVPGPTLSQQDALAGHDSVGAAGR